MASGARSLNLTGAPRQLLKNHLLLFDQNFHLRLRFCTIFRNLAWTAISKFSTAFHRFQPIFDFTKNEKSIWGTIDFSFSEADKRLQILIFVPTFLRISKLGSFSWFSPFYLQKFQNWSILRTLFELLISKFFLQKHKKWVSRTRTFRSSSATWWPSSSRSNINSLN